MANSKAEKIRVAIVRMPDDDIAHILAALALSAEYAQSEHMADRFIELYEKLDPGRERHARQWRRRMTAARGAYLAVGNLIFAEAQDLPAA
jgi:hypothetical protein